MNEAKSNISAGKKAYQVDWHSLLDSLCNMYFEKEEITEYGSFDEAKEYVREGLSVVLAILGEISQQVSEAHTFENLDLGWWEPLIEEIVAGDD
jgi:hypothetical protein